MNRSFFECCSAGSREPVLVLCRVSWQPSTGCSFSCKYVAFACVTAIFNQYAMISWHNALSFSVQSCHGHATPANFMYLSSTEKVPQEIVVLQGQMWLLLKQLLRLLLIKPMQLQQMQWQLVPLLPQALQTLLLLLHLHLLQQVLALLKPLQMLQMQVHCKQLKRHKS